MTEGIQLEDRLIKKSFIILVRVWQKMYDSRFDDWITNIESPKESDNILLKHWDSCETNIKIHIMDSPKRKFLKTFSSILSLRKEKKDGPYSTRRASDESEINNFFSLFGSAITLSIDHKRRKHLVKNTFRNMWDHWIL